MKTTGKPIMLMPKPDIHALIRQAAAIQGKPMTHFIMDLTLKEVKKILEKNRGKS